MDETSEPKISLPEAIIIGLLMAVLDALDILPIAGDITDAPAALLFLYYQVKGISGTMFAIAWVLDLIPIIQEFPSRSVAWWIGVYMDRHPSKVGRIVEQVGEIAQGEEGEAALAEGTEEEIAAEGAAKSGRRTIEGEGTVEETGTGTVETAQQGKRTAAPEKESIETERASEGREEASEEEARENNQQAEGEKDEELEKELETKEELPYDEVLEGELFEDAPKENQDNADEEPEDKSSENPTPQDDEFTRAKKALEVKRQLQKAKDAKEVTADEDQDTLDRAA